MRCATATALRAVAQRQAIASLQSLLDVKERNFLAVAAVMAWLDMHLLMMLLQVGLMLLQDAVDEALIGSECLEEIGGDFALEPVRLLCLVDVEVVALDVLDRLEELLSERGGLSGRFGRFRAALSPCARRGCWTR